MLESFLVHLERSIIAMAERSVIFKNRWVYLFIFDCAGSSWLHGFFPSCGERELPSSCSVQALHCGGFSCCRAWALGCGGSVVAAPGLWDTDSLVVAHVGPDQWSNLCLLNQQADSLPLGGQGSPKDVLLTSVSWSFDWAG